MTQSGGSWTCWQLALTATLGIGGAVVAFSGSCALGQIQPDATLGAERTSVTRNVSIKNRSSERIEGGAKRGGNLFHSFQTFNIDAGKGAYFTNPIGIKNIFSRVTGNDRSDIQGTLGVLGKADLFLINPNGIIFGPNASLDLQGSFLASTASSIKFANDKHFSTMAPQATPILKVSVPIGLQFNINPRSVVVQGSGLQVQPGQTLSLVGGDVTLDGGILFAPGGRVELGGVAGERTVGLTNDGNKLRSSFPSGVKLANISFTNEAGVDVSGEGGGNVQLQGNRLDMTQGSYVFANTLGSGDGGEVLVRTTEAIALSGSDITADVLASGTGTGGDLRIQTGQLTVRDGAQVGAGTFGEGPGGSLNVIASSIELIGESPDGPFPSGLFANTTSTGAAGDMRIRTGQLIVRDGAQISAAAGFDSEGQAGNLTVIASESVELSGAAGSVGSSGLFTQTLGAGAAGDLIIETRRLIIQDGAEVSTGTIGRGRAGTLAIRASDSVKLSGKFADFPSRLSTGTGDAAAAGDLTITTGKLLVQDGAQLVAITLGMGQGGSLIIHASDSVELLGGFVLTRTQGAGAAGDLAIETRRLIVRDGAQIQTGTLGEGDAGSLAVQARKSVEVIGESVDGPSGLFTSVLPGAMGDGGGLAIETGQLVVRDGAQIQATTFGEGDAGSLTVQAHELVELSGTSAFDSRIPSGLLVSTEAAGDAGDLKILTGQLNIRDKAEVIVGSLGSGKAGKLQVQARSVRLDTQGAITATTRSGNGGNITLRAQDLLLLRRNSQISTQAGTEETPGTGGSISIDTDNFVALENSDIDANAFGGSGGQVFINAQGIFGTEAREQQSPQTSDITASSDQGPEFSGTVEINTPDVDPSQGIADLPTEPVNTEIAQDCQGGGEKTASRFISSGSGGLPTNPYEPLDSRDILADVQPPAQWLKSPIDATPTSPAPKTGPESVVEAQGWSINQKGDVILVAEVPRDLFQRGCRLR